MLEELAKKIGAKGDEVRAAKAAKAGNVDQLVLELKKLKEDYKTENGGVAFGPPPDDKKKKEAKKGPAQQESTREGPSKKELNKLEAKAKRMAATAAAKVGSAEGANDKAPGSVALASMNSTSATKEKGALSVLLPERKKGDKSDPCALTKSVIDLVGGAAKQIPQKESAEMGDCEPCLVGGGTSSISGDVNICRFIVRSFVPALYSSLDAWGASQVDQWLDLYVQADPIGLLSIVESHLADKTFLVGSSLTLADVAISLIAKKKRGALPNRINIERWLSLIGDCMDKLSSDFAKTTSSDADADADAGEADSRPALEGAVDGQVVVRFPPEPSGYLHIGHVKACLLNEYYAKRYNGKLRLRLDDTNPSKEKEEYQKNILSDLATIKVYPDEVSYSVQPI